MFEIKLRNNKSFLCDSETTIFDAAKKAGFFLEHSCLTARCRSCIVRVVSGKTVNVEKELVLTKEEKKLKFVLSCNAKPKSNLILDIEAIKGIKIYDKRIVPAKINSIEKITKDVIKVVFRLPPNSNFSFNSGQYVNLIKGSLSRSYSIANKYCKNNQLEFFIKKYKSGLMSKYWFEEAKVNDLLRIEGPLGSFFLRDSNCKDIIFLATGTGVAPIKSILDSISGSSNKFKNKKIWIILGARYEQDIIWEPNIINSKLNITYIPVLSRDDEHWRGEIGYVQDVILKQNINLEKAQVYACGSNKMIVSAKKILIKNSLKSNQFYSDAFICTN